MTRTLRVEVFYPASTWVTSHGCQEVVTNLKTKSIIEFTTASSIIPPHYGDGRNEGTSCLETMQSIEEQQVILKKDVAVMPVGGLRD
jgi:hypothetical protein